MSALLPPLANVVAFRSVDPDRTARVRAHLERTWPDMALVRGWLLATRPLPKSRPAPADARSRALAFVEGAERAAGMDGGLEQVSAIAREHRYERLAAIPGDVGFVWLGEHEAVAVRSAAGLVPWYWWASDGDVAVGSHLTEVAALQRGPLELDPLLAALWASGQAMFLDRRTPIAGVHAAHPGEVVRVAIDGDTSVQQWFDPWPEHLPRARRGAFRAKADAFGAAIRTSVADDLARDGGNLLSLSGGVDSSTLAWLAHHADRPLAALSFVPRAGNAATERERVYLAPLVERLGIAPHVTRELTEAGRVAWLAGLPAVVMPVRHPVLCLLGEVVAAEHLTVLIGGEFCDELCGGAFALKDWMRTATVVEVAQRVLRGEREGVRSWARHRRGGHVIGGPYRALPPIVRTELSAAFDAWRRERDAQVAVSPKVHAHTIELMMANGGALAQNWEVCSALGVRRSFPFLTRGVIEVVAACRPSELISPVAKHLSRTAFRGQVPDLWLDRVDAGAFGPDEPAALQLPEPLPSVLATVLRPEVMAGDVGISGFFSGSTAHSLLRWVTSLTWIGQPAVADGTHDHLG